MKAKIATATVVAAGAIAALIFTRRPLSERIIDQPPAVPGPGCEPEPMRGDLICQVARGEADPLSVNFDPESCGYCGDGIRQVQINGAHGSAPRTDEFGIRTQDVIQRFTEIPSNDPRASEPNSGQRFIICNIDYACGNGHVDDRQPYGAWVAPTVSGAPFVFGIKPVTETRETCSLDTNPTVRRTRTSSSPQPDDPIVPSPTPNWYCPTRIASTDPVAILSTQSASVQNVLRRLSGRLTQRRTDLRRALGVTDPSAQIDVTVVILVSAAGSLSIQRISARCNGAACGDRTSIINATGLSVDDIPMAPPEADCTWTITVNVPRD
jgi:hypothetical protein